MKQFLYHFTPSTKQDYRQTQCTIRQFEADTGYLVSFESVNLDFYNSHLLVKGDIVGDINYHLKSKSLIGDRVKHLPYEKEASLYVSKFICDRKTNWNISKSTDE
jgi:hypothetical protein